MLLISAGGGGFGDCSEWVRLLIFVAVIGFFTSIMYPIIFTLSIDGLGNYTKTSSSLLIMGIIGGA